MVVDSTTKTLGAVAIGVVIAIGSSLAPSGARAQAAPDYAALLAAPDRSDVDRQADARRDPLPFLQFTDVCVVGP